MDRLRRRSLKLLTEGAVYFAACRVIVLVLRSRPRFLVSDYEDEGRGRFYYFTASARAQASASKIFSSVGCETTLCASITRRTVSVICGKLIFPFTNASTATSFAAFNTAGNVPPVSPARRASFSAGKRSTSGSSNVKLPSFTKSVCTRSLGKRSGYVKAY